MTLTPSVVPTLAEATEALVAAALAEDVGPGDFTTLWTVPEEHTCEAVIDHARRAVALSGATVTPEAAVWAEGSGLVYRGRIDDLYVDFGKQRVEPSQRDLREVLDAILSGEIPPFRSTKAIGCYIEETGK